MLVSARVQQPWEYMFDIMEQTIYMIVTPCKSCCRNNCTSGCSARAPATHCNTLQHDAAHCNTHTCTSGCAASAPATYSNTLQHTYASQNTQHGPQQRTATNCNTLQYTATCCNTLQHTAANCSTLQHIAAHCSTLQHTTAHYSTLQHTATHCNTLQHTATHTHAPQDAQQGQSSPQTRARICCRKNQRRYWGRAPFFCGCGRDGAPTPQIVGCQNMYTFYLVIPYIYSHTLHIFWLDGVDK